MKKSQRLRFYALVTKQSTGTLLTDAELAEFRTLSALNSQHPNSAEDTDDTTTEPASSVAPATAPPAAAPAAAAPAPAAAKPGVSAKLTAAMQALAGGTPAQAAAALQTEQQAHAATKATLSQAQADLTTLRASLESTRTALSTVCDFFGIKPEEVAGKTQADVDALLAAKISAAATEKLASLGVSSGKLPAPKPGGSADSKTMTSAEFAALTPGQKSDFSVKGGRIVD